MLQKVMPDIMAIKNTMVINDEAHDCYREEPFNLDDEDLKSDERIETEENNKVA